MFDICLLPEIPIEMDEGEPLIWGTLQIGDFSERFVASLFEWSAERYRQQWAEAAQRLVDGDPKSAFVTSFLSPENAGHFEWWPCYKVNEIVFVQNQLRFYEQLTSPFRIDALYDYISDRKIVSEDGSSSVSEWQMPIRWIRDFLTRNAFAWGHRNRAISAMKQLDAVRLGAGPGQLM